MDKLVNVIILFVLLSSLGVCCSYEIPKFSHVNVTFRLRSDEVIFLKKITEAKVYFDEGKRSIEGRQSYPLVQEFFVEKNSIPDFEDMVERLQLNRTNYTKSRNEYVKLFLTPRDKLQKELIEVGIKLQELKLNINTEDLKAYPIEVSLVPQIEAIALKIGMLNVNFDKTRLSNFSVTFTKREAEDELHERLERFHVPVEEIKMSDHEKWDQEYYFGKYDVEYFLEPHLFEDFAYALGVTLLE